MRAKGNDGTLPKCTRPAAAAAALLRNARAHARCDTARARACTHTPAHQRQQAGSDAAAPALPIGPPSTQQRATCVTAVAASSSHAHACMHRPAGGAAPSANPHASQPGTPSCPGPNTPPPSKHHQHHHQHLPMVAALVGCNPARRQQRTASSKAARTPAAAVQAHNITCAVLAQKRSGSQSCSRRSHQTPSPDALHSWPQHVGCSTDCRSNSTSAH